MTVIEKIQSCDIDTLAAFMYGLINGTEERLMGNLASLGIEVSLCTMSEDVRIEQMKQDLLKEWCDPHDS